MKSIKYKFVDGTTKTIEVSDEFYEEYEILEKETKSLERKETRRNVSLTTFEEKGIEFEDESFDIEENLEKEISYEQLHTAIKELTIKQQKLIHEVFVEGKSYSQIAREQNIKQPAISQQINTILGKLRKILRKK